jgi:hypothetical protein
LIDDESLLVSAVCGLDGTTLTIPTRINEMQVSPHPQSTGDGIFRKGDVDLPLPYIVTRKQSHGLIQDPSQSPSRMGQI